MHRIFALLFFTLTFYASAQSWQPVEATLTGSANSFLNRWGHSWADVDGDGDFDLVLNGDQALWINRVNESAGFVNMTATMFPTLLGSGWAACFGDFDNDGDPDIHFGNSGVDFLLENRWPEPFVNVAAAMKLTDPEWNQSVNWADYNRDGLLDIYVTHEVPGGLEGAHRLFENGYPGPFIPKFPTQNGQEDVVGLADMNSHAYGVTWADIDLDNDLDAVTSACGSATTIPGEQPHNKAYRNNYPAPTFEDMALASGLVDAQEVQNGSSSYWATLFDYNNDALPDLFIGKTGSGEHRLWRNDGNFQLTEVDGAIHNLGGQSAFLESAVAGDYDNDGDMDLYTTTRGLFENLGDGSFANRSDLVPAQRDTDASFVDYDLDGHLDLFTHAELYRNPANSGNNWIAIELEGGGTATGTTRSAHHVKITVQAGGRTQIREHRYMVGSYSQHMLPTHFGLGDATVVDSIRIHWLNGNEDVFTNVPVNQYVTFTEQVNCTDSLEVVQERFRYCGDPLVNLEASKTGEGNVYWSVVEGRNVDPIQFGSPNALATTFTPSSSGYWRLKIRFVDGCPEQKFVELYDTDYNSDGVYNLQDLYLMGVQWLATENIFPYDLDDNGLVDIRDFLSRCTDP